MAVAAPARRTSAAPGAGALADRRRRRRKAPRAPHARPPLQSAPRRRRPRARPPRPRAAPRPARPPPPSAPRRKPRRAAGGQLIPLAGRTAVAVRQLPDSGLIVRMTRGRAWIAVLGVLLVGIVALNVVTLSFAASSGKIDEQITALEQENSILGGREAQHFSTGPDPQRSGRCGPGDADHRRAARDRGRPRRRRHRGRSASPPPARARSAADALDRAPDRAALRRLPALLPGHRRPRLLAAGGAGRRSLASQAISQQTETVTVPGLRGSLLDRRGNKLAASEDAATIYATPYQVKNPPQAAAKLAPILELSQRRRAESADRRIAASPTSPTKSTSAPAAKIERLKLEGIGELPDSRRTYPQGEMAGQVIGAVGSENQGLTGLEAGEESVLGGTDGERRIVNDALGDPIRLETVKEAERRRRHPADPRPGDPARRPKQVLAEVGETYSPKGATAIVVDPRTSQILAMANWPPVDPNDLSDASNEDLMNKATGFTYEPGSTFKAFTVAAALEEKLVTPTTEFTLPPSIQVADRTIEDAEERGTETMSVAEILAHSSNVGAVDDRARGRRRKIQQVDRPLRLRPPDRGPVPGRGAGASCPSSTNTRARRWATCRSARASR